MAAKNSPTIWKLMRAAVGALVMLSAGAVAQAATVTFSLSPNDDGSGTHAPGMFAVYADVSLDNGGLFAFGVDLQGNIDAFLNMAPRGEFRDAPGGALNPIKYLGFSAGVTEDPVAGKISGLPDLAKGSNLIPVYGFGQEDGDLNNFRPPGYNPYFDSNGNAPGSAYKKHLLLGIGTYSGAMPTWQRGSVDNKASVYDNRSGTESVLATLQLNEIIFDDFSNVRLTSAAEHANQAVGGAILVSGSNGKYASEVDQLQNPSVALGSAPIQTIGDEAGNVYVMAKLLGVESEIAAALSAPDVASRVAGPTDSQYASLHASYDAQFGGGGFNALFKFPNVAGPKVFNWDFSSHGVTIDQLAAVPEPGTIGLIALAATGLVLRRRRN